MNAARASAPAEGMQSRQQFVSDVFHAMSQPLTALRCSLELALMQQGDAQTYRSALEEALAQAERMTHCAEFLRSMAEADDPGHPCELDLCASVGDVVNDFIPVFQHAGHKLVFHAGTPVKVVADPDKLARALFLLIDGYAVQECDLSVQVRAPGVLQFRRGTYHEHGSERVRQSIALAQRMLSATQAKIHTVDHGAEQRMIVRWDTSARSNRRCGL